MQMAYRGENPEHIGYGEYDLEVGLDYCNGYLQEGYTVDLIGGFDLQDFHEWCERRLKLMKPETEDV